MKEYIVRVEDDDLDYDELFIGYIRKQTELIRCRDCMRWNSKYHDCEFHDDGRDWDADDYCSRGKPKKGTRKEFPAGFFDKRRKEADSE